MMNLLHFTFAFYIAISGVWSSRVLELSDKFIDISKSGQWLVKFYAPWCAHCRRLEPTWAQVAQSLYNTPIKVAKVDCTRFTSVANHFKIRAFPTIMFFKESFLHEYIDERTKEDLVDYAKRMSYPSVRRIMHPGSMAFVKEEHSLFFAYVGKEEGPLWEVFSMHAEKYQPYNWFYAMTREAVMNDFRDLNESSVFVYKDGEAFFFQTSRKLLNNKETLNTTLNKWIDTERFGFFPKITRSNINHIVNTGKYIVMAVVSENKLSAITSTEKEFKDMIEDIIRKRKGDLHDRFQFGWVGSPDLANSIAMTELTVPNLIVLNSTTNHHHVPDDDPVLMTPEAVTMFLESIHRQEAPAYGGNSWFVVLYRTFYEAKTSLINMWRGNPVLTTLVFGLPFGFLSLIFYSVCCGDILEADDEEDNAETHEKKD